MVFNWQALCIVGYDITDSLIIAPQIAPLYPKEPGGHRNTSGTIQRGENKVRTMNHRDRAE